MSPRPSIAGKVDFRAVEAVQAPAGIHAHPKPPPPPPPPSAGYPVERMDLPPGWSQGEAD